MEEKQGILTEQDILKMSKEEQEKALADSLRQLMATDREAGMKFLKMLNPDLVAVNTNELFTRGRKPNRAERRAMKHRGK
jgi:hypothetical protein